MNYNEILIYYREKKETWAKQKNPYSLNLNYGDSYGYLLSPPDINNIKLYEKDNNLFLPMNFRYYLMVISNEIFTNELPYKVFLSNKPGKCIIPKNINYIKFDDGDFDKVYNSLKGMIKISETNFSNIYVVINGNRLDTVWEYNGECLKKLDTFENYIMREVNGDKIKSNLNAVVNSTDFLTSFFDNGGLQYNS